MANNIKEKLTIKIEMKMLKIENLSKIRESAQSVLPPNLELYSSFETHTKYVFSFVYKKYYAKDIYVELDRINACSERHPGYILKVNGNSHTLWDNGAPIKTDIYPIRIERVIKNFSLKNPIHFLEGLSEIIIGNFDDPGYHM